MRSEKEILDELVRATLRLRKLRTRQALLETLFKRLEELDGKRDRPD
jgi:hypothetical protein